MLQAEISRLTLEFSSKYPSQMGQMLADYPCTEHGTDILKLEPGRWTHVITYATEQGPERHR